MTALQENRDYGLNESARTGNLLVPSCANLNHLFTPSAPPIVTLHSLPQQVCTDCDKSENHIQPWQLDGQVLIERHGCTVEKGYRLCAPRGESREGRARLRLIRI